MIGLTVWRKPVSEKNRPVVYRCETLEEARRLLKGNEWVPEPGNYLRKKGGEDLWVEVWDQVEARRLVA